MLLAQEHVRVFAQNFEHVRFIVFRTDRQHDAAPAQVQGFALKRLVGGTDLDAVKAVLTDNSPP